MDLHNMLDRPSLPSLTKIFPPSPTSPQSDHSDRSPPWHTSPERAACREERALPLLCSPYPPRPGPAPLLTPPSAPRASHCSRKKAPNQKWDAEEDRKIIELRGSGMKWADISRQLPGRTEIGCRLHYQNYLEKKGEWDEEKKTRLARVYERLKQDLWQPIATELGVPWRAAEAMHWILGERELARRVNISTPFSSAVRSSDGDVFIFPDRRPEDFEYEHQPDRPVSSHGSHARRPTESALFPTATRRGSGSESPQYSLFETISRSREYNIALDSQRRSTLRNDDSRHPTAIASCRMPVRRHSEMAVRRNSDHKPRLSPSARGSPASTANTPLSTSPDSLPVRLPPIQTQDIPDRTLLPPLHLKTLHDRSWKRVSASESDIEVDFDRRRKRARNST